MEGFQSVQSLETFFGTSVHASLIEAPIVYRCPEVEQYLTKLLIRFLHQDEVFSIRNKNGDRIRSLKEMLEYADVSQKATSFHRERSVHRHIGDFLLFWSGVFPEFLPKVATTESIVDLTAQGAESYFVVSTFNFQPYEEESLLYRYLSEGFHVYQNSLRKVRSSFEGFSGGAWNGLAS